MKSKRSMRERMQSRRGASLPLALLLTLVCAMVASVVLAASTAAAGRASGLAENDQAYYSVASAVNVFRDELLGVDGKDRYAVTVAVEVKDGSPNIYDYRIGTDKYSTDDPNKNLYKNFRGEGEKLNVLERAAIKLLFDRDDIVSNDLNDDGMLHNVIKTYFENLSSDARREWPKQSSFNTGKVGTFDLSASSEDTSLQSQLNKLKITVDVELTGDSSLLFTFHYTGDGSSKNEAKYSMRCDADIATEAIDSGDNSTIKYVTITWTPSTIEKSQGAS